MSVGMIDTKPHDMPNYAFVVYGLEPRRIYCLSAKLYLDPQLISWNLSMLSFVVLLCEGYGATVRRSNIFYA